MMKSGKLVSLEGIEGAGKTKQAGLLVEQLVGKGVEAVSLREPGGTQISEKIREVLLSVKNKKMTDLTEVLLFQAARAQIYDEVVLPALLEGKVVVMDRTSDSSVVYQGMVRGVGVELVERLNRISTQGTMPDLTILLEVRVKVGLDRRAREGGVDRIDAEGREFHQRVKRGYLELAERDRSNRWVVVDGERSVDEVAEEVWGVVVERLGLEV